MEAYITLDCSDYSENIYDVIKLFQQIGWGIYNHQGKLNIYLLMIMICMIGNVKKISESELCDIVSKKVENKEPIGVNLFYNNGSEGISFLAENTEEILLSISIYRYLQGCFMKLHISL